jgi:hypothetical protein
LDIEAVALFSGAPFWEIAIAHCKEKVTCHTREVNLTKLTVLSLYALVWAPRVLTKSSKYVPWWRVLYPIERFQGDSYNSICHEAVLGFLWIHDYKVTLLGATGERRKAISRKLRASRS